MFFSVSHASDATAIAVSADVAVGVDLEDVRDLGDRMEFTEFSKFVCTERELRDVAASPLPAATLRLLNYWVAKEAVLKGVGEGVPFGLRRVEAYLEGERPTAVVDGDADAWSVRFLELQPGRVGAVAARAPDVGVRATFVRDRADLLRASAN
jgi:4'-phosphopantetheinyl transferase